MIDFHTVKSAASGRWPEILSYLGIPGEALTGKHGPCPQCGGKDRFRWDDIKDAYFCSGGGALTGGDGFSLLHHCGWQKADALHAVAQYLNIENVMLSDRDKRIVALQVRKAQQAKLEATLAHELHILYQTVTPRVNGRINADDKAFREAHPEWRQPPDDHWAREVEAANNVRFLLEQLYGGAE